MKYCWLLFGLSVALGGSVERDSLEGTCGFKPSSSLLHDTADLLCASTASSDTNVKEFADVMTKILDGVDLVFPAGNTFISIVKYFLGLIPLDDKDKDPMKEVKDQIEGLSRQISDGIANLKHLIKKVQFQDTVVLAEDRVNSALRDYLNESTVEGRHKALIDACNTQTPCVMIKFFLEDVLKKDESFVNTALENAKFGYAEYLQFRLLLTRTTLSLMHSCAFCEILKNDGDVAKNNIEDARNKANEILSQLQEGSNNQKKRFWPGHVKDAVLGYLDAKAVDEKDKKYALGMQTFLEDKYSKRLDGTLTQIRFGCIISRDADIQIAANEPENKIVFDYKDYKVLIYNVSDFILSYQDKWRSQVQNYKPADLLSYTIGYEVADEFFDDIASQVKFPVIYMVKLRVEWGGTTVQSFVSASDSTNIFLTTNRNVFYFDPFANIQREVLHLNLFFGM